MEHRASGGDSVRCRAARATLAAPRVFLALVAVAGLAAGAARGQVSVGAYGDRLDAARLRADAEALAAVGASRAVGTAGYDAAVAMLESELRGIPGVELRVHHYDLMAPVTASATLDVPGDGDGGGAETAEVFPLTPASVRLNATPAGGVTGRLVYCGEGGDDQIVPAEVSGQIAVIEATAGRRWRAGFYFGARAVVLLGSPGVTHVDLRDHDLNLPVDLPRVYLPDGPLADRLRRGGAGAATLRVSADWKRVTATNFYALVAPRRPTGKAALVIAAPFEAASLVPGLAPGAGQATQAAAALAMLRDLAADPPERPVMVYLGGADTRQGRATREMLLALADAPSAWRADLSTLAVQRSAVEADLARLRELGGDPLKLDPSGGDRALAGRLVQLVETDLALEQDELFALRTLGGGEATDAQRDERARLEGRQIRLSRVRYALRDDPRDLLKPFRPVFGAPAPRAGVAAGPEQTPLEIAASYLPRLEARLAGSAEKEGMLGQLARRRAALQGRVDLYEWLAGRLGRDADPGANDTASRLIEVMVGLDLSDRGVRVGPVFEGMAERTSQIALIQDARDWFTTLQRASRVGEASAAWFAGVAPLVDLEPLNQGRTAVTFTAAPLALPTELSAAWGVPGFTLATLGDLRLRRDTPNDAADAVDFGAVTLQARAAYEVVRRAWADPSFRGGAENRRARTRFEGRVVSPAPGKPVPDLPREGFLVVADYVNNDTDRVPRLRGDVPYAIGLRRTEVADTDAEGLYRFEGLSKLNAGQRVLAVRVYGVEPGTGRVTAATDLGKTSGDIKVYANLNTDLNPLRSIVFPCESFTLTGLYDPRFLQDLGEVTLMDARRNAEPQKYDYSIARRMMAAFVEPGSRSYLLFRYGRVGNRLVLLNVGGDTNVGAEAAGRAGDLAPAGEAHGYTVGQLRALPPLALATARDFFRLDAARLSDYRRAGVSSPLLDGMQAESGRQIGRATAVLGGAGGGESEAGTAAALMNPATGAWANQARVYDAAQGMANDVIYAAIFLLLLSVPFAFCVERLVVGTPSVYRQIGGIAAVFAAMAAALYSFHPAFKISASPLIIVLAFAIILMSGVVISVIYGRFDGELKKIRSGRGGAQGASFARASVLSAAINLGIANMRRRKFRTVLTATTVVLITFAVLCFTSSTRYRASTQLPTGVAATHPGVMLRQRGYRQMPEEILSGLRSALPGIVAGAANVEAKTEVGAGDPAADPTTEAGRAEAGSAGEVPIVVERWWVLNAGETKDQVDVVAGGVAVDGTAPRVFSAQAVLGLSPGESKLSAIGEVIGPGYDRLERGEADVIYLARQSAEQLGVGVGDAVRVGGMSLEVAGVFDADAFDGRVVTLGGEPLAPLRYSSGMLDAGGQRLSDVNETSLGLDADSSAAELGGTYEYLPSTQFAVVPAATARRLENCSLRSVAFRAAGPPVVDAAADELSRRYALALYAGPAEGGAVELVSAGQPASISGGQVAIPLAIGGLIIFNTMMGSIAERRREIHVYTSLGLAPVHVGALFVAEAMTYGLIGAVFGYVIGQAAGTVLSDLGWLGDVTLNYSGTSAMLTMGLILLVVLLSALVPARLASKIAAPSIDRTWRVPARTAT